MRKRAFTLIEMLLVLGIIAALVSATIAGYGKVRQSAERAKAKELVSQVATALTEIYNEDGVWPRKIREASQGEGLLNAEVSYILAKRGLLSLTHDDDAKRTTGLDRFGVVSPWATDVLKRQGKAATESSVVGDDYAGASHTVRDHILRFKVDLDGDGIVEDVACGSSGSPVDVRAVVVVWCAGKDGRLEGYSEGLKRDDVYSWTPGQTRSVK